PNCGSASAGTGGSNRARSARADDHPRRQGFVPRQWRPGATATNFFEVAGNAPNTMQAARMMSAEAVARIGYAGLARGERVTVTGIMNRVLTLAAAHTPHWLT